MPSYVPLVTPSGRIFSQSNTKPEPDGLFAIIDLKTKGKDHIATHLAFNAAGDSLLIADSRNQVTLLQLSLNRFNVVAADLKEVPVSVTFTGRATNDQVLIVLAQQRKLRIYSLTGKC